MKKLIVFLSMIVIAIASTANAAEVLVKYFSETTFEIGDIIEVQEDGYYVNWNWPVNHTVVVRLPGVPVEDFNMFLQSLYDSNDWSNLAVPPGLIKKRRYNIDTVNIPQPIKNQLDANREITFTEEQWNNYINDKDGQLP